MSTRYDICTPRKGRDDKTRWTRIGTAFDGRADGKGIQLIFDALPIADSEGRVVANLFEPREPNDRAKSAGNDRQQSQQRAQSFADDGDSIPF